MDAEPLATRTDDPHFARRYKLSAKLEPFDSYWQAPADVESGYAKFAEYYKYNYLPHLPGDLGARILVISCGPGYLVDVLKKHGYETVVGIDSDPAKIELARQRNLDCRKAYAFEFLEDDQEAWDVIIPEQELNHLTHDETIQFLSLCRSRLNENGIVFVYAMNGANPMVGSENLSHNIDHFYTVTEHSISQLLKLAKFRDVRPLPLRIYVFWRNPINYIGLFVTGVLEWTFRVLYKIYGKNVKVLSKKIAAIGRR